MNIRILAAILILLNSCAAYYPQVADIPLIKEKGDIRIDIGSFLAPNLSGEGIPGVNATISAGLTNIIAIQGYFSSDMLFNGHLQGALGLFKWFEDKTVMEIYSGYGFGGSGLENNNISNNSYHLIFTQFNIGKSDLGSAHIDCGLGLKGGRLYSKIEDYREPEPIYRNGWTLEPSVFFRLGGSKVKFCAKVSYLSCKIIEDQDYSPLNVSMGINIYLGKHQNNN